MVFPLDPVTPIILTLLSGVIGMILAAGDGDVVKVLEVSDEVAEGEEIH